MSAKSHAPSKDQQVSRSPAPEATMSVDPELEAQASLGNAAQLESMQEESIPMAEDDSWFTEAYSNQEGWETMTKSSNDNSRGEGGQYSLASYRDGENAADVVMGRAEVGALHDKQGRVGTDLEASVFKGKYDVAPEKTGGLVEVAGPGAGVEVSVGDGGLTAGVSANLASVNAELVNQKDSGSNQDRYAKFGVGEGVGAAARLHYGDEDGDGYRRYGFGFDLGPFSMDYSTEDPLKDYLTGSLVGVGAQLYPGNMTADVTDLGSGEYGVGASGAAAAYGLDPAARGEGGESEELKRAQEELSFTDAFGHTHDKETYEAEKRARATNSLSDETAAEVARAKADS